MAAQDERTDSGLCRVAGRRRHIREAHQRWRRGAADCYFQAKVRDTRSHRQIDGTGLPRVGGDGLSIHEIDLQERGFAGAAVVQVRRVQLGPVRFVDHFAVSF